MTNNYVENTTNKDEVNSQFDPPSKIAGFFVYKYWHILVVYGICTLTEAFGGLKKIGVVKKRWKIGLFFPVCFAMMELVKC